jgi:hypothetical protein
MNRTRRDYARSIIDRLLVSGSGMTSEEAVSVARDIARDTGGTNSIHNWLPKALHKAALGRMDAVVRALVDRLELSRCRVRLMHSGGELEKAYILPAENQWECADVMLCPATPRAEFGAILWFDRTEFAITGS